jgi:hypothetical protein
MTLPAVDEAIADLFNEHARSLVRLARLFVDDRSAAEDLVQEAFLRLHGSFHRIENHDRALAVRTDSLESHERWIATPRAKGGLGPVSSSRSRELARSAHRPDLTTPEPGR